jgi:hypothetical protein
MKRTILAIILLLCVVAFLIFWFIRNQHRSPVDKTTYDAISLGMPEDEAMRLVPIPHRASGKGKDRGEAIIQFEEEAGKAYFKSDEVSVKEAEDGTFSFFDVATGREVARVRFWDTDDYELVILFSPDGEVMGKTIRRFASTKGGWWEPVRQFLRP